LYFSGVKRRRLKNQAGQCVSKTKKTQIRGQGGDKTGFLGDVEKALRTGPTKQKSNDLASVPRTGKKKDDRAKYYRRTTCPKPDYRKEEERESDFYASFVGGIFDTTPKGGCIK